MERLKVENGMVEFILISGNQRIVNKMLESEAKAILKNGNVQKRGNEIVVDDKFIFATGDKPPTEAAPKAEPKTEQKADVKAEADKPLSEAVKEDKPLTKKPRSKKKKK